MENTSAYLDHARGELVILQKELKLIGELGNAPDITIGELKILTEHLRSISSRMDDLRSETRQRRLDHRAKRGF